MVSGQQTRATRSISYENHKLIVTSCCRHHAALTVNEGGLILYEGDINIFHATVGHNNG